MNGHLSPDRLSDLAEGRLDGSSRTRADRHLAGCAQCREELESIRALRSELHSLPRGIEPARDLRPGIWRAVDAAPGAAPAGMPGSLAEVGDVGPGLTVEPAVRGLSAKPRWRDRSLSSARWPLATAALALIAITAMLTFMLSRRPAVAFDVAAPALSSVLAVAGRYETATAELQRILAGHRDRLSPATLRVLEQNLRVIDQALTESRAALRADPGNAALSAILISAYERKLDVLRAATATAGI